MAKTRQITETVYRLGELFSGPGGLALGAISARVRAKNTVHRIEHEWASDYDEDTCKTYRRNICADSKDSVICQDIRKLRFDKLSPIDALAFGFPCNDFSIVGQKKGTEGTYGPLYSYGITALRHFQPKFFVAENVGGLRSANDGVALRTILTEMEESGYDVVAHYYKFEQYGVPQARHRIIIVGIRNDLGVTFSVPAPLTTPIETARKALEEPPIQDNAPNHVFSRQSSTVVERLKHIKAGENAFNADLPPHLRLNVAGAKISTIYKRLDPDKPAYTITGSGGGGTHVYHWSEHRALTNRERARLQTFPDTFVFEGSNESIRKQIGMAVPPKAAKFVFDAILQCLAGRRYDSVEPNIELRSLIADKAV